MVGKQFSLILRTCVSTGLLTPFGPCITSASEKMQVGMVANKEQPLRAILLVSIYVCE